MEVAAAQMAYEDVQVGRVIDELQRMGALDNTLIAVVLGDNGASGEAGPPGTINELRSIQTHDESEAWMQANTDRLGSAATYENYPVGWAWAMNSPYRWTKQFASMLGGIRNGAIIAWKGHNAHPGSICAQIADLIDLAPSILDAAHLPAPQTVYGIRQKPIDGESLLPSLTACDANKPRTKYFEIGGKMGLYHDGWFLSGDDGRPSWEMTLTAKDQRKVEWTLYDLTKDFSQSTDLSAKDPRQLQAMLALWQQEATRNHVFPIDYRRAMERADRASVGPPRKHFDYWGKDVSIPATGSAPFLAARNFTLDAAIVLDRDDSSGAVLAWGSKFGGWSLFLDHGRPAFVWAKSTDPSEMATIRADKPLPQGASTLRLRFTTQGPGKGAEAVLSAGGVELAKGHLPDNAFTPSGGGETLDVGRDLGVTVTDYATPHGRIEGDVPHVAIDFD
jgi:arylsulfatase